MLETELQALKAEVVSLREAISSLTAAMIGAAHASLPTTPEPVPEVEPVKVEPITVDALQAWCMEMVRKDPDTKPKIKEIIASFDGAKTIGKVPTDRLPELKAALEALQ
jgi:hypothetical protein